MFYDKQPQKARKQYKEMLETIGSLSNLFSDSETPYLSYRANENIFCKCFDAENLARSDNPIDAKKGNIGIGLKTFVPYGNQKVAEFGRLKPTYEKLSGLKLVKLISQYRNERIRIAKNMYNVDTLIYHIIRREAGKMQILECPFDTIDISSIKILKGKGRSNNTYFSDGKHEYHFSVSKNTLYMIFDNLSLLDEFPVKIETKPYDLLHSLILFRENSIASQTANYVASGDSVQLELETFGQQPKQQLCLPLYSIKNGKRFVPPKSGLNQWNASGRQRDPNEIYIPYNTIDRNRNSTFFPPRNTAFTLHLPDGKELSAKVCQGADPLNPDVGKAIMSNPNKCLGEWLLRDVFELPEKTVVTYEMLERFGVDSVVFIKNSDSDYSVDFSEIGTYENFYGEEG